MSAKVASVPQTYGVARWGEGYFGINADGHATVRPRPELDAEIDLYELACSLTASGLRLPVLVRFNDILRHRVRDLCGAFHGAAEAIGYRGGYRAVYPIKVNQQRSVVEQIVAGGGDCVGLEAGSKPELMAVLATSPWWRASSGSPPRSTEPTRPASRLRTNPTPRERSCGVFVLTRGVFGPSPVLQASPAARRRLPHRASRPAPRGRAGRSPGPRSNRTG